MFAASSLKAAFEQMVSNLDEVGLEPAYNFAGSQELVSQLSLGAKADVFASADLKNMQAAITAGFIDSGAQQVMAANALVVITPPGGLSTVTSLQDLARPGIKLDLADPSVPAGNYALQVLDKLSTDLAYGKDFKDKALANVASRETNVRQVLSKVQLGQADAGIVYTTDARTAQGDNAIGIINIPARYNVIARYYIAPVKDAAHPQAASGFIRFILSADGQRILARYGFDTIETK